MILDEIRQTNDIKKLEPHQWAVLAEEIRSFLVASISKTGGHLASNLGVVELTMALHLSFDLPKDKLIWDVGHQSYTHKLLTGRRDGFEDLRKYGGMSGFPKRKESNCDAFDTGHSSTSISAGLGYVRSRELTEENYQVVSILGDGALTGGMAYEALNNASMLKSNFMIVLNDNCMSISRNIGGVSSYLSGLRTMKGYTGLKKGVAHTLHKMPVAGNLLAKFLKRTKDSVKQLLVPRMFFEDMGITYLGPVDGHDIKALCRVFQEARRIEHGVLIHVLTKKGKGYVPAEQCPEKFHGTGPFEIGTGKEIIHSPKESCTKVFSETICQEGASHPKLVAITAAMEDGTGLKEFAKQYPRRFFDVGIAEQHGVTFAAGLAAAGMKPVVAIYSSFLQRAYDQIIHDVCIQNLPVFFAIDRAGLVGNDGETHQGIFDISYLTQIPNMTVLSPKNKWELADMIRFAVEYDAPIALRYPRGTAYDGLEEFRAPIVYGKSEMIFKGEQIAILSEGHMMKTAMKVCHHLKEQGIFATLVNIRFLKPLDCDTIEETANAHRLLVTIEENVLIGGFGEQVSAYVNQKGLPARVLSFGIGDEYVEHGSIAMLRKEVGLDDVSIVRRILKLYQEMLP